MPVATRHAPRHPYYYPPQTPAQQVLGVLALGFANISACMHNPRFAARMRGMYGTCAAPTRNMRAAR